MKLSTILSAKSELADELENKIEWLSRDVKSYKEQYSDSEMPLFVVSEMEKSELKINYLESILKSLPDLK